MILGTGTSLLQARERQVLAFLMAKGGRAFLGPTIRRDTGMTTAQIDAAVDRLASKGLVDLRVNEIGGLLIVARGSGVA